MMYDVFADWEINLFCNFNCSYCFFHSRKFSRDTRYSGHDVGKIVDAFNSRQGNWLIHMTGGEPFFQPDFIELCAKLTQKHHISVNSNFSTPNVYDFADRLDPRKVARVNAALHICQRKDLEEFIRKIRYFDERGFNVYVSQVMYPPILNSFERVFQHLKQRGIVTRPKAFRGCYKMRRYPQSYTEEERRLFMRYYDQSESSFSSSKEPNLDWLFSFEKHLLNGELSFKGARCGTGRNYVYIRYNGNVLRCIRGRRLGNIFRHQIDLSIEPELCKSGICYCPSYGLRYSEGRPSVKSLRLKGLRMNLYKKAFDWKENAQYVLSKF
jgi:MoaA/NifB/PqqE/SkfB family radical SAM enzyme